MITQLTIKNFKSFKEVNLNLGALNIFIGANASGKSNFFDAMRLLQGIGYGFTIHEILNGKPKSATSDVWEGIRGGSNKAMFLNGQTGDEEKLIQFAMEIRMEGDIVGTGKYMIGLSADQGSIRLENLSWNEKTIYNTSPEGERPIINSPDSPVVEARYYHGKSRGHAPHIRFEKARPILYQLAKNRKCLKEHEAILQAISRVLSNQQRVDPQPRLLRDYSQAREINRMGENGENFAALVKTICAKSDIKEAFETWLKELRPTEVDSIGVLSGAVGEPLFMVKEGGKDFPAQVLSDGTLRFVAITASLFQPDLPSLLAIEEIENGIHASRLRLMVELLRNRIAQGNTQMMITTHSPIVLAWLKPEEYATTFFCKRSEETGESVITPLTEIPRFNDVVAKQPIGDLFAEGWLESAL